MARVTWARERERWKAGIAIAASVPMIATTIMISTSVKLASRCTRPFAFPLRHGGCRRLERDEGVGQVAVAGGLGLKVEMAAIAG